MTAAAQTATMLDDPWAWLRAFDDGVRSWQEEESLRASETARATPAFPWVYALNLENQTADSALYSPPRLLAGRWFRRELAGEPTGVFVSDAPDGLGRPLTTAVELVSLEDERPVHIWFFEPSADGHYCAVSYSFGGDTDGHWVVVDTASGTRLPVHAPSLLFNSPRPGWLPDGAGFLLGERAASGAHRLTLVRLDGSVETVVEHDLKDVGALVPALLPQVSRAGTWVAQLSAPHELAVRRLGHLATGVWRRFLPEDYHGECYGEWADDETYVAIATEGSPRGRVVGIPAATSTDRSTWQELVPESDAVLRALTVTPEGLVLLELRDVSLGVRFIDLDGVGHDLPIPAHGSSLRTTLRLPSPTDAVVIDYQSFTRSPSFVELDTRRHLLRSLGDEATELPGIVVDQQFATAVDGTRLPFYVVQRADLPREGVLPTLVYAYGGYNAPVTPAFLGHNLPFVRAGGRYIVANLRGGGEYGEDWHEAARLLTKQTTYDDLYSIVEYIIECELATPNLLALQGFSNGGATAGVAAVQRPDLWRVVSPGAPMLDFLQVVEAGPSAEAMRSYMTSEFGDPNDPEQGAVLLAMSPYHNIRDGVAYPAVYSVFGASDPGCAPFSGRVFTARMRSATSSGLPVLLRVWPDTGHGATGDAGAQWNAEWMAFVLDELGMDVPA